MFPTGAVARALKQDPYFSRMESGRARLQPLSERSHVCIMCKLWLRRILELFGVSRLDISPQCDRTSLHALTTEASLVLRSSILPTSFVASTSMARTGRPSHAHIPHFIKALEHDRPGFASPVCRDGSVRLYCFPLLTHSSCTSFLRYISHLVSKRRSGSAILWFDPR